MPPGFVAAAIWVSYLVSGLPYQPGTRYDGSCSSSWLDHLPKETRLAREARDICRLYETNTRARLGNDCDNTSMMNQGSLVCLAKTVPNRSLGVAISGTYDRSDVLRPSSSAIYIRSALSVCNGNSVY